MGKTFLGVRDVDEEALRKFKTLAVAKKLKLGEAITKALNEWAAKENERKHKPDPKNLLKLSGIIKTKEKVKWSEEIDDILYGS